MAFCTRDAMWRRRIWPWWPAAVRVLEGADACRAAQLIGEGAGASGYRQRHGGKRGRDALAARGSYVEVRLREGRNRQVRRMLEAVGHPVIALHREAFGPLVLGDLPRGASRPLAEEEVARLKELAS